MAQDVPALPVLLVEDDLDLAGNVQDYLEHYGWRVDYASNGAIALHRLLTETYSAVLLDLNLPGLNGLELSGRIRAEEATASLPILMLTAADSLEDRLNGFDQGADDYLVKPFALPELLARLGALVRRSQSDPKTPQQKTLELADLQLDPTLRKVTRAGKELTLTNMGFALLELLLKKSPAVVSKSEIENHLWGDELPGSDSLRTHIASLRSELDQSPWPPLLRTHRGIGYQLTP
jgi:DNA-binding response OmpR family regulator